MPALPGRVRTQASREAHAGRADRHRAFPRSRVMGRRPEGQRSPASRLGGRWASRGSPHGRCVTRAPVSHGLSFKNAISPPARPLAFKQAGAYRNSRAADPPRLPARSGGWHHLGDAGVCLLATVVTPQARRRRPAGMRQRPVFDEGAEL